MKLLGIITALMLAALAGYRTLYPSLTMRYRLTLEARVDGKPVVGSGVIEVTYSKQPQITVQRDLAIDYRGEAVVLDLGSSGVIFALLKAGVDSRSSPETIIFRAFGFDGGAFPGWTVEEGFDRLLHLSGSRDLPLANLPMLVRFRDMSDPKTVERVNPGYLSTSFPGATLERATLEVVSARMWPFNLFGHAGPPITTGIEKRLPWLSEYYNLRFDGQRYEIISPPSSLANSLASGAFKAGQQ
jgi:hypothetical protein